MKLLFCPACYDVIRLIPKRWRLCDCKQSGGQYNEDGMTATLGGLAKVLGIANPFFNELWSVLNEEQKKAYRDSHKYGPGDCWWGEFKGDTQIFRVNDPEGPRLKVLVESVDVQTNRIFIIDDRPYSIDGQKLESVDVPANPVPSFKGKKGKKRKRS